MKRFATLLLAFSLLLGSVTPAFAALDPGSAVVNFTVQNLDDVNAANVQASYVNQSGAVVARVPNSGTIAIPKESSRGFPASDSGLPSGFEGSAIVAGDRELAGFAQVLFSGGTSADGKTLAAYNAFTAGANKLYFPSLSARANKQYSTLTIMSAENPSTTESINFSIKFYDRNGNLSKPAVNDSVRKGSQKTFNLLSQGLPTTDPPGDGWLGSAVVESTSPIAGVALTHWGQYSAGYSGVTGGGTKAYLPSGTRRLPTGPYEQFTAIQVQNLDAVDAANVTVRWYDRTGAQLHSFTDTIQPNSSKGYNTQFNANTPNPGALFSALGTNWNGSVVVESTNGKNIVAIANLQWTAISGPGESASAYASEPSGKATIYVPGTFRRVTGSTWEQYTGLIVQNVGGAACNNFDVIWKDRDGNVKLDYKDSLNPNIAHGYNTRVDSDLTALGENPADLGSQFRGSVTFKAPGCSLVAIHNTLFPEWTDSSTYNAFGK